MNILETIIAQKKIEVQNKKASTSIAELEKYALYSRKPFSLKQYLKDKNKTGIIAEFKRCSPSKGIINATADVLEVTKAYTQHGASAISILTDENFFGGSNDDLIKARVNELPILRKDFIIDEYQITEAKAIGADVILLIAACLTTAQVNALSTYAKSLGLEVLLELHGEDELSHICDATEIIGINNRNLKTFEVDIEQSIKMASMLPSETIKVAESGIRSVEEIIFFKQNGFDGFLIGENFMKTTNPAIAFAQFTQQLKAKNNE